MNILQTTNLLIIRQLTDLLRQLPQGIFYQALKSLHQHSVGQHTRHVAEFYQCLLKGLETGSVNYDGRERNLRIETDKAYAVEVLEMAAQQIAQLSHNKLMTLHTSFGGEETAEVPTSFFRELTYLIEHTVHHLAIIRIGLNEAHPDIFIPEHFGVAPSTLQYREQIAQAS